MRLEPNKTKKIAVFRALQLGDLLCAIPAIRALRHAYPDAEISLLGLPWAGSFVQRFNAYFNRFIHFPGYPGLPEQGFNNDEFRRFIEKMQDEEFDLILQMQGNGTIVNSVLFLFGAKHVAGYFNSDCEVYSPLFMRYPDFGPEIERHLMLMQHLKIPVKGNHLEFPISDADKKSLDVLYLPLSPKGYVCVHPGSRGSWRQWPPRFFAKLADYCIEKGYVVFITGTTEEGEITAEMIKYMRHQAIDLTGKTNLGAVALLIKNAFLLISNCTGVSHIAAATGTPSIVISMDGEPFRWGPLNKKLHTTIDWKNNPKFETVLEELVGRLNNAGLTAANHIVTTLS